MAWKNNVETRQCTTCYILRVKAVGQAEKIIKLLPFNCQHFSHRHRV